MTDQRQTAPYGEWPSPLSAAAVAQAGVRKTDVTVANGEVYWSERRPLEKGRSVIVRATASGKQDVVGESRNVRSTAHEYGGACYTVLPGGDLVFVDHDTRALIHRRSDTGNERTILVDKTRAFADLLFDARHHRIIAACELIVDTSEGQPPTEPIALLVSISLDATNDQETKGVTTLIDSRELARDFVTTPRLSPSGDQLAFVAWRHPNMPWDESEVWLADIQDGGTCVNARRVAGGDGVSVFQPEFSPDGTLHFVSDESGWWNLYRFDNERETVVHLLPMEAEFALPQWVFGMSTYKIPRPDLLVAICSSQGQWQAGTIDPTVDSPSWRPLPAIERKSVGTNTTGDATIGEQFTFFDSVAADQERIAMLAAGPVDQPLVLSWTPSNLADAPSVLDQANFEQLAPEAIARGVDISFDSPFSEPAALTANTTRRPSHAFYYPPTSTTHEGVEGTQPPLIVKSHGGPTAATNNALDPAIQFWTSRGFAVVDVNYGGSTGYGRSYRERLDGNWGVVDVEDCASAALYLADQGLADVNRLIIRGGSAGGYTTLAALAFTEVFRAGASLYGIGDLETLARDTHKFESRYLDRMIGPYPEARDLYRARSPIHAADQLSCPVIFFQGTDDKVVPPNQSEAMVDALRSKGVRTEYVLFEGEGHGFRRSENIIRALEAELGFYHSCFES